MQSRDQHFSTHDKPGSEAAVEQLSQPVMIASSTIPLELCDEYSTPSDSDTQKAKKYSVRKLSMTRMRTLLINRVLGIQYLDPWRACTLFLLLRRLSPEETVSTRLTHNLGCN